MTEAEFEELIKKYESEILDFKSEIHDLNGNDFTKDVVAFYNTPREQPAYIIYGIKEDIPGQKSLIGLATQRDDVDFQKAFKKEMVQPLPSFNYIPMTYRGNQYGVLKIAIPDSGPCTFIQERQGISKGVIYYRKGSENERAAGTELTRITSWFNTRQIGAGEHDKETWLNFLEAVNNFTPRSKYILIADSTIGQGDDISSLGMIPWRAAIDFDPESENTGLLHNIEKKLENIRTVHRIIKGDRKINPEPGVHWFFAAGLSGRTNTCVQDYKDWKKSYTTELQIQLNMLASDILPSSSIAIILWNDDTNIKYLRDLLYNIDIKFGDKIEMVLLSRGGDAIRRLVEEAEEDYNLKHIDLRLKTLCNGINVHMNDILQTHGRYIVPSVSGAPVEINQKDWLWLSEDLEIIHRDITHNEHPDAISYRRGGNITWSNLELRHDCDRDITKRIYEAIDNSLRKRVTELFDIFHLPGAGGTTLAKRIAWDLHGSYPTCILKQCTPKDTLQKIMHLVHVTNSSVFIVVDSDSNLERSVEELDDLLRSEQAPVVILRVSRHFKASTPNLRKRQYELSELLNLSELKRFKDVYIRDVQQKRQALENITHPATAFTFGLTAYENDFLGITPYVKKHVENITADQRKILIYIAISHYYGNQAISADTFSNIIGLPSSKYIEMENAFGANSQRALELLVVNEKYEWRTIHPIIAREMIHQLMVPSQNKSSTSWEQYLSEWAKSFITFCRGQDETTSKNLLGLIQRIFVSRGNEGSMSNLQGIFSPIILEIPEVLGRISVLTHLTEEFPNEAHFHAHLGRAQAYTGDFVKALESINFAIELNHEDHVLYHMKGMVLRQEANKIGSELKEEEGIHMMLDIAEDASISFERSRELKNEHGHAYISEVQLLIKMLDHISKVTKQPIYEYLSKHQTDEFLSSALERAENLLDQAQHLNDDSSNDYIADLQGRIKRLYGDHSAALRAWDHMLTRPNTNKVMIRKQIVWTMLDKHHHDWSAFLPKEYTRIQQLMEENIGEETYDASSMKLWIRVIRETSKNIPLDSIIEKVSYWKTNTKSLDATYYLYVLHTINAIEGSTLSAYDADQIMQDCQQIARYRRDRRISYEWLGNGSGLLALIHQSKLGKWVDGFWSNPEKLKYAYGRISSILGPEKGYIEINNGLNVFFVPDKFGFVQGRDENTKVKFHIGFSYDGPIAWSVEGHELEK